MYELEGKVALVTGAAGEHGIGRAIARRLAREGADVVVNDLNRNGSDKWGGLDAVVAEIESLGRRGLAVTGSVAESNDVARMVDEALQTFGRIDTLVNNAASPAGPDRVPVVELDEAVWGLVQSVNVKGTFLCSRAVARHMIGRGAVGKSSTFPRPRAKEAILATPLTAPPNLRLSDSPNPSRWSSPPIRST